MLLFRDWLGLRRGSTVMAAALSTMLFCTPAQASGGYWRYTGYTLAPTQAELEAVDRLDRERGGLSERRVTGAYQAADSGAATVELFFKNADADRRVYITTMTFSFTTGTEMRSLRAGQTLRLNSTLAVGGNDLSRALPASGTGTVWVNNGNYLINLTGGINQQVSAGGNFVVPRGSGKGDTLTIHVAGHIGSYGALNGTLHANYVWVPDAAPTGVTPPAGATAGARQWMTGTFNTTEGTLYLTPNGGTYTQDNGKIRVTSIAGARMEGYWEEGSSDRQCADGRYYGRIRWTFTARGFTGTWGYCDDEPTRGNWSGTRQ